MATPFISDQSSRNIERVCQVEGSHQEHPNCNLSRPAAKKRVVGFDCEFVERPPKAFQVDCPVCLLVLREPHQATCCGYSYCQPCIERVLFDKKPCPTCNTEAFSVFPNKGFQRSLYEFHVRCSHEKDGCQWTGELGELDRHLNGSPILGRQFIGCEFAEVECNDCGKSFQRQHFKAHQLEQHLFSCEYCHNYESYYEDVVKNHWPVCGSRPVPCPNECGVYPERQNLEHHVSKDCPLTVVNCDYHYAGCEVQLIRQDLPAHLAENLVPHMAQLATYNQKKVQEKDQQIMQLTEDLRQELERNRQKIDQLEKENEALSTSLLEKKDEIAQLQGDLSVKDKVTTDKITELREEITQLQENMHKKDEAMRQEIVELKQEQQEKENKMIAQLKTTEEEAQEEVDAIMEEITRIQEHVCKEDEAMRQEIVQLKKEQQENESKLKTTEEEAQKKGEMLQHEIAALKQRQEDAVSKEESEAMKQEIAELRDTSASKEGNDALSKSLLQLQEDVRVKEEATRRENDLLKQEIATLKDEITQLQENMYKQDKVVRQEIVELKQEQRESENEMIARLKTTEEEAQKKEETLQHEIAALKRRQEDAVSKEESEAMKQEIAELRETSVSKEENEAVNQEVIQVGKTKQELTQLKAKQEEDRSSLQTLQSYITTTPPLEFTMTEFAKHKRDKDIWYSEPFYTHPHGYKMCLKVDANGNDYGKDTHISVFCYLMRGKFDDHLRWPFLGHITIQVINQLADNEHCTTVIHSSDTSSVYTSRVTTGERSTNGYGTIKFLPHSELGHDSAKNRQFLKDDCLCFRVTRVTNWDWISLERQCLAIESRVCVPPFEFTMTDFEQQRVNAEWCSPSFYTHPRGYRMCLEVDANGNGDGEGTHISAYVRLMRGEWDNYLKWPFRGDITIQLLNQIEDKGHHEIIIPFTDKTPVVMLVE